MATNAAYLPVLVRGLPPAPDAELNPYLDAAVTCFAQQGIARTSIGDIAKVVGVSRTTVYRHLGTIDNTVSLVVARELHRFQETVPTALEGASGPDGLVRIIAALIRFARQDPVLAKVLRDEPDSVGTLLATQGVDSFQLVADVIMPPLEVAIAAGLIRQHDPAALAHWIARVSAALVLAPPPVDLDQLLDDMLLPILEPVRQR